MSSIDSLVPNALFVLLWVLGGSLAGWFLALAAHLETSREWRGPLSVRKTQVLVLLTFLLLIGCASEISGLMSIPTLSKTIALVLTIVAVTLSTAITWRAVRPTS